MFSLWQTNLDTSVGKTGCPTREAARRRILRRMKETELKDEKSCTTASNSDSKLPPNSKVVEPEHLYRGNSEEESKDKESDCNKFGRDGLFLLSKGKRKAKEVVEWVKRKGQQEKEKIVDPFDDSDGDHKNEVKQKRSKRKKKADQIDDLMSLMPAMTNAVTRAALAHEKAVKKWQCISDTE
ncbi:uncharacterized protein LOC116308109 isoform X2 [Actinia tenebrosa]|uniref:Uncharacterized protein LOC116308109 isoform X2 n=1 Tax=Actinia tenebrosa TaxID=6105 RepID=A0A6P8J3X4_ACTTE|nr:uncharacterized protein LOC116308109 isoform X2 [Actinia tenebrosa]